MEPRDPSAAYMRGKNPSIIQSFEIKGLYGYRTLSLASNYAATILIAKNGSGKTTLLGALDAFLRSQFARLRDLQFREITCKIRGHDELLTLRHEDIIDFVEIPPESELARLARSLEVEPLALARFLSSNYADLLGSYIDGLEANISNALIRHANYSYKQAKALCDATAEEMFGRNSNIKTIRNALKNALRGIDIVYLPTYRRIELPLEPESNPNDSTYSSRKKKKFQLKGGGLFTADIQFGLADISDRLAQLNQTVLTESNLGYREISASIINEMIDGAFDREDTETADIPNKAELSLFFSRLKDGRRVRPFDQVSVPNIDRIYTGENISDESNKFLRYFLRKLGTVIKATRDIELQVEVFVDSCNRYLSSQGFVDSVPNNSRKIDQQPKNFDGKLLQLNRKDLKVHVESLPSGKKLSLETLSSGEKQMISLFANLFLYPKNKIILIDEPELSLSIDWQQQILVDVINAPSCSQLIAITHSPFIFDNPLEPFARSLTLSFEAEPFSDFIEREIEIDE
ncbi:AAA family ATPase [Roseomonas gilardii]|uniref:AAA family ATPase n=1 Tax=Roseomonas gilardii TaxID=257708 RepID=UPI0016439000|nr:AAA family ATPase [Roseomonas gilardii]